MRDNHKIAGYLLIVLSAFCFSLFGIISSFLFKSGIKTYDLIIMQNIAQLSILAIYFSFEKFKALKVTINDLKIIGIQGLLASFPVAVLYYIAIQRTNVSIACLLLFTNPIFVTLYFILFEKQKNSMGKILAVFTVFIGTVFVLNIRPNYFSHIDIIGVIAGILSSISYAFYNVYADKKLRNYSPGTILFYCTIVVIVCVSIINYSFYIRVTHMDFSLLKYTLPISALANSLPVIFLYTGIKKIGAQAASIIASGEVPFTVILSYFILNETLNPLQIFGSVLIVGAIIALTLEKV